MHLFLIGYQSGGVEVGFEESMGHRRDSKYRATLLRCLAVKENLEGNDCKLNRYQNKKYI